MEYGLMRSGMNKFTPTEVDLEDLIDKINPCT